ncbi:MAG: hypothetical protein U9R79_21525 [Armatimonadota bacterium]|nr:hypothetical protein [Armatimonadota bacterium]
MFLTHRAQDDKLIRRLDPSYWHTGYDEVLAGCQLPLRPLGEFIDHITYGAIVTGRRPQMTRGGIPMIGQGALGTSGVDMAGAVHVARGSPWAIERAMVRRGDLLIARSGAGSLERNRLAVYHAEEPAVVDCFVDLVRLGGLDPDYVAAFLRTRFGWAQIHRLLNGVGPANLSFDEIRSLQVPPCPALERQVADRHLAEVLLLHRARLFDEASEAVRGLVADLEAALAAGRDRLRPAGR